MRVAVVFQSKSGNTRKLAENIFECLDDDAVLYDLDEGDYYPQADFYFVGFGIHNGTCGIDVAQFIESLEDKKLAIFMNSGMPPTEKYKNNLIKNIEVWLPDSGELVDSFLCQGEMERYVLDVMIGKMPNAEPQLKELYRQGKSHPDENDLDNLKKFVSGVMEKITD